jgi:hypothetical protein
VAAYGQKREVDVFAVPERPVGADDGAQDRGQLRVTGAVRGCAVVV